MDRLPKRKANRLIKYDYSSPGTYFITICTSERNKILSEIYAKDSSDKYVNVLSTYGVIADKYIKQISDFYGHITVEKYVIMPNHIHLLLNVSTFGCGTSGTPSPTNNTVSSFVSTFKRFCNREYGENIWQRRFHDHIVRGDKDYLKIWEYIDTNVQKWDKDCFYVE